MTNPHLQFSALLTVLGIALCGCSGTTWSENADAGSVATGGKAGVAGGPSSGGASGVGGSGAGGSVICCNAMPTCGMGETMLTSPNDCPAGAQCYSVSLCCTQIWCMKGLRDAGTCNPTADYNLHYVSTNVSQCPAIDFICPTNTTYFFNGCGCGCQQSASCPQYVDCMPGTGTPNALCTDSKACPYTTRAM